MHTDTDPIQSLKPSPSESSVDHPISIQMTHEQKKRLKLLSLGLTCYIAIVELILYFSCIFLPPIQCKQSALCHYYCFFPDSEPPPFLKV